jgi:hypothetical protein
MKIKKVLLGFFVLMGAMPLTAAAQGATAADAREAYLMRSAELGIVSDMARVLSRSVQETHEKLLRACPETETGLCQAVCPHPIASGGVIEFTISFIGLVRSDAAADTLVNLLGLRLDGGGSEILSCQILIHGRALLSRLERLEAKSLAEHCQSNFYELKGLRAISDVTVDKMCRTEAEILRRRDEFVEAIKLDTECTW